MGDRGGEVVAAGLCREETRAWVVVGMNLEAICINPCRVSVMQTFALAIPVAHLRERGLTGSEQCRGRVKCPSREGQRFRSILYLDNSGKSDKCMYCFCLGSLCFSRLILSLSTLRPIYPTLYTSIYLP